jgi:hypothetical protein
MPSAMERQDEAIVFDLHAGPWQHWQYPGNSGWRREELWIAK